MLHVHLLFLLPAEGRVEGGEHARGLELGEFGGVEVVEGAVFAAKVEDVGSDGEVEGVLLVGAFLE